MFKNNATKRLLTLGILIAVLAIFLGASKPKVPAPEILVAQVYVPKDSKQDPELNLKFNISPDAETYEVKIEKLTFNLNTKSKDIENVRYNNRKVKHLNEIKIINTACQVSQCEITFSLTPWLLKLTEAEKTKEVQMRSRSVDGRYSRPEKVNLQHIAAPPDFKPTLQGPTEDQGGTQTQGQGSGYDPSTGSKALDEGNLGDKTKQKQ